MLYSLKNDYLSIEASTLGAELQSIIKDGHEYLWQGNEAYWKSRCLNMFPFCGRNTFGKYYLDSKLFELDTHGFARNSEFMLESQTVSSMTFLLKSNEKTIKAYPRVFEFRVIYELESNSLNIRYEVTNLDKKTMYFGLGLHPGFNIPLEEGKTLSDHKIRFTEECHPIRIGETDTGYLNSTDVPYELDFNAIQINKEILSHPFCLTDIPRKLEFFCGEKRKIIMSYPDMNYLALWQVHKEDTPYICIEPWTSIPAKDNEIAVFEEKKDLISLESGKTYKNEIRITIKS